MVAILPKLRVANSPIARLIIAVLLALLSTQVMADDYLRELTEAARIKKLWLDPVWLKLLHYKPNALMGGYASQVDAPQFFMAEDGKRNPQHELAATLAGFFEPFPDDRDEQQFHPQCRFIARYRWLKAELGFDDKQLPEHPCWRFEEWLEALNPAGLTLIFPVAYINSPATMFGHTLLRIDARGQTEQNKLLSYAINFAANAGEDGGLAFAVRGLLGGYPGSYSVLPYYLKVREYSDMENRDIWEYHIRLSEQETRIMLLHAWELRGIWFDYYFFDENCSYHLLSLMETARPDLHLTDQFGAWAIPSDTVRVLDEAGLIDRVIFRPSRLSALTYRMSSLDRRQIAEVKKLARAEIDPSDVSITNQSASQQAQLLELAHEYADYHKLDDEQYLHGLLQVRSALGVISPQVDVPGGTSPDRGHRTGRSSLISGREDGHNYQELQLRPAYHDLLDLQPGYTQGAQIAFFDTAFRRDSHSGDVKLQYLIPVNIVSLTPVSDISIPISWQFDFGLLRKHGQRHNRLLSSVNGGAGLGWAPMKNSIVYTLFNFGVDADSEELRNGYAAGTGGSLGMLAYLNDGWAMHLFARQLDYYAGDKHNEHVMGLESRVGLSPSDTLRIRWARGKQLGDEFTDINLSWQHYF